MSCTYPTVELTAEELSQLWTSAQPSDDAVHGTGTSVNLTVTAAAELQAQPVIVDPMLDPAFGVKLDGVPCQELDADLWFAEIPSDLERAKSHCRACPVRAGCLAGALERREPWGVWGGEIFDQGVVVARKRPRGRPRKTESEAAA